jgi:hypothetical protein
MRAEQLKLIVPALILALLIFIRAQKMEKLFLWALVPIKAALSLMWDAKFALAADAALDVNQHLLAYKTAVHAQLVAHFAHIR